MTSRAMSNPLLSSYSSCFVFTKHPVQLKTVTTNDMFSKHVLFEKGHLNKRAGVWTPWTPPLWIRHCKYITIKDNNPNTVNSTVIAANTLPLQYTVKPP